MLSKAAWHWDLLPSRPLVITSKDRAGGLLSQKAVHVCGTGYTSRRSSSPTRARTMCWSLGGGGVRWGGSPAMVVFCGSLLQRSVVQWRAGPVSPGAGSRPANPNT